MDIENEQYKNSVIYSNELKCDDPEFNKNLLIEFDNGELPGSDVLFAGNEAQISVQ